MFVIFSTLSNAYWSKKYGWVENIELADTYSESECKSHCLTNLISDAEFRRL